MVLVGFVVAVEMIFYYVSVRPRQRDHRRLARVPGAGVGGAAAPLVLHTRRQRIDMIAMAIALGGMALLVLPALPAVPGRTSIPGLVFGLLAGLLFAAAMMIIKSIGAGRARLHLHALLLPGQRHPAHAARRRGRRSQPLPAHLDRHVDRAGQRARVHRAVLQPLQRRPPLRARRARRHPRVPRAGHGAALGAAAHRRGAAVDDAAPAAP